MSTVDDLFKIVVAGLWDSATGNGETYHDAGWNADEAIDACTPFPKLGLSDEEYEDLYRRVDAFLAASRNGGQTP